jgi:hypothetical protein
MLKYLRIAVTALSLTACVLLIALWVRSYWSYDWLGNLSFIPQGNDLHPKDGCLFESANGVLVVLYIGSVPESYSGVRRLIGRSPPLANLRVTGDEGESTWNGFRAKVYPNGIIRVSVPHWFLALVTGTAAALSWNKWRFSLRTLLIATTLVSLGMGTVIYLTA